MEEILQRYLQGNVSEDERKKIIEWLEESPEHMRQFMAMHKLYDISLWNVKGLQEDKKGRKTAFRKVMVRVLEIAAVAALVFWVTATFLGPGFAGGSPASMQTIVVPAGQRAELILTDGTEVWLNSRSTLKFPSHFKKSNRAVELDGEGYFKVTHDESAPFTVKTENYDVVVLGTEFNVKAYKKYDTFETSLLKGSVDIVSNQTSDKVRLEPNKTAKEEDGQLVVSSIEFYDYYRWKEGLFCFEDETVADLIESMKLYYDINIEVKCPDLMNFSYSGKFRIKDGIEHVLKVLQLDHKFTYTRNEELNLIVIN